MPLATVEVFHANIRGQLARNGQVVSSTGCLPSVRFLFWSNVTASDRPVPARGI